MLDSISGKVNMVMLQPGWNDRWYHRYSYDAENRLVLAETSTDSLVWEKEARYEYYRHGPLARMVIGEQQVQGVDYAYTLQGWLKGINSTGGSITHDMGGDGLSGGMNQYTAKDAIGLTLNYFAGDYKPIQAGVNPFPAYSAFLNTDYKPLYNGNISSASIYNSKFGSGSPNDSILFHNYQYDQLNRLKKDDVYKHFSVAGNNWSDLALVDHNRYRVRYSYDANGNIKTLDRHSSIFYFYGTGNISIMDSLEYSYYPGTNQLRRVTDDVTAGQFGANSWDVIKDIDNQDSADNYVYDAIGNLIKDKGEKINNIEWNVYGKIKRIERTATSLVNTSYIAYTYDAQGNRISKETDYNGIKRYTWYVRDAQGNLLATYKAEGNVPLTSLSPSQSERYIYGSSMIGSDIFGNGVNNGPYSMQYYSGSIFSRGRKQYELANHLGNVLATISDKKIGVSSGGSLTVSDAAIAEAE